MHLSFKTLLSLALLAAFCSATSYDVDARLPQVPSDGDSGDSGGTVDAPKLSAAQKLQRSRKTGGSRSGAGLRDGVDPSLFREMEDDFDSANAWKQSMRDSDGLPIPHVVYPEPYVEVGHGKQLYKRQHDPDQLVDNVFYAMEPPRYAPADTDVPSGEDQQMLMYRQMKSEFRSIPYNVAPRPPKRALPQRFIQRPVEPQQVELVPTEDGIEVHPVEPEVEEPVQEPAEPEGPAIKIKVQDKDNRLEKRKFNINANVPPCDYSKDNLSLREHRKCPSYCSNRLLPCRKHCVSPYVQQTSTGQPRVFPDPGKHYHREDPFNFSPPKDYKKATAPASSDVPLYQSEHGEVQLFPEQPRRKSLGSVGNLSPKGTPKYSDASQPALPVWNKPMEKANRKPQGYPNWNPPMEKANRKPQGFPNWSKKSTVAGDPEDFKVISELPDGFKHLAVPGANVVLYKIPIEESPKTISLVPKILTPETSTLMFAIPKSLTFHTSTLLSVPDSLTFTKMVPTTSVSTSTTYSVATMTTIIPARQALVEVPVSLVSTMTSVSLATATTEIPARLALVEVPIPSDSTVVHAISWTTSVIPFTTSTHIPAVVAFVEPTATVTPSLIVIPTTSTSTMTLEASQPPILLAELAPTTTTKSFVATYVTPVVVTALSSATSMTSVVATLTPKASVSWSTSTNTYTQTTQIPAAIAVPKYQNAPMGISEALLAPLVLEAPSTVTVQTRTLRPRDMPTPGHPSAEEVAVWGPFGNPYKAYMPGYRPNGGVPAKGYTPPRATIEPVVGSPRPHPTKISKREAGPKDSIRPFSTFVTERKIKRDTNAPEPTGKNEN